MALFGVADEASGITMATITNRRAPIAVITQRILAHGWWPRMYSLPLVSWRNRSWNTLADNLCNLAMNTESDCKFQATEFAQWQFVPGQLIQCHSDGGVRSDSKAAAACTLMVLCLSNGNLERRLLRAEAVFIKDGSTSDIAERCALTLAMRTMQEFIAGFSPVVYNI